MDKALAEKWVKALRSGKYRQTIGTLKRGVSVDTDKPSYCCLGVLAVSCTKELRAAGVSVYIRPDEVVVGTAPDTRAAETFYPSVAERIGLDVGFMSELIRWNDREVEFSVIAERIEHRYCKE